jgi:hypothetical protein
MGLRRRLAWGGWKEAGGGRGRRSREQSGVEGDRSRPPCRASSRCSFALELRHLSIGSGSPQRHGTRTAHSTAHSCIMSGPRNGDTGDRVEPDLAQVWIRAPVSEALVDKPRPSRSSRAGKAQPLL